MPEPATHSTDHSSVSPVARSPLLLAGRPTVAGGWEYSSGVDEGPVVVADRSAISKVLIRTRATPAVAEALGTRFGRATWDGDRLVIGSGPDEWLVMGRPASAAVLIEKFDRIVTAASSGPVTIIDLTHGRALIRVSGPETMALFSRVTAVDLDERLVPNGSALRTSLARVVTDMVRDDIFGAPSYLLHCERSSGRYLQASLMAAGSDLGVVQGSSNPAWPDRTS